MNKLKKVGLSALAGTLASLSAQAGELSVTGTAEISYTQRDGDEITGNALGMNKALGFAGSGELDNGWTVTVSQSLANGGLTATMSEEVITPQGSEMMEEEVVEETPAVGSSAPLTFEQLRQRLPKEIPDDVIRLLASSDEALLEFSNIATQQDVDEFNVKYGVELVLPQV